MHIYAYGDSSFIYAYLILRFHIPTQYSNTFYSECFQIMLHTMYTNFTIVILNLKCSDVCVSHKLFIPFFSFHHNMNSFDSK